MTVNENSLSTKKLNNFIVSMRASIKQARIHVINHHGKRIKALSKQKTNNKNKKKTLKMSQEIKGLKCFSDVDLSKLVLINKKSFEDASNDGSSVGQRLVARVAEHKAVSECCNKFKEEFADSLKDLPFCIKMLGNRKRYKKIEKVGGSGKKDKFLETERFLFKLLKEVGGSEFYEAEDLYEKYKRQKKHEKMDRKAQTGETNEKDSNIVEQMTAQQEEIQSQRKKILAKLDEKFGEMDDVETDSDSEDEDLFPTFNDIEVAEKSNDEISSETNKEKSNQNNVEKSKEAINEKSNDSDESSSEDNDDSSLSKDYSDEEEFEKNTNSMDSKIIQPKVSRSSNNNTNTKSVSKIAPTPSSLQSQNIEESSSQNKNESTKKSNVSTNSDTVKFKVTSSAEPENIRPKFSISEVMTLDLAKLTTENVSIGKGNKREREVDTTTEELFELPRKLIRQKKSESSEPLNKKKKASYFMAIGSETEESDSDDEEEKGRREADRFNKKYNKFDAEGTHLEEAFNGGNRGMRGRGRGNNSRGGKDNNRGSGGWGDSSRGSFDKPRGENFASKSEAGETTSSSSWVSRGRGGGRGMGNRPQSSYAPKESTEDLHPSWAAKKNQKLSITGFQGKKIKFD